VTIDDFIWLPTIVEKLMVKHHLNPEEVEEVFIGKPRFKYVESGLRPGEDVYAATGQTAGGRYLIVFFIWKDTHTALIISAREMDRGERRRYERK
jgi:uncharacterized DUF497 family protein